MSFWSSVKEVATQILHKLFANDDSKTSIPPPNTSTFPNQPSPPVKVITHPLPGDSNVSVVSPGSTLPPIGKPSNSPQPQSKTTNSKGNNNSRITIGGRPSSQQVAGLYQSSKSAFSAFSSTICIPCILASLQKVSVGSNTGSSIPSQPVGTPLPSGIQGPTYNPQGNTFNPNQPPDPIHHPNNGDHSNGGKTPPNTKTKRLLWPTMKRKISGFEFGDDWKVKHFVNGSPVWVTDLKNRFKKHTGIDIGGDSGDPVFATGDGVVRFSANLGDGWRYVVAIDHSEWYGSSLTAIYWHLESPLTGGSRVSRGDTIGVLSGIESLVNNEHLHFGLRTAKFDDSIVDINIHGALPEEGERHKQHNDPAFPDRFVDPRLFEYEYK